MCLRSLLPSFRAITAAFLLFQYGTGRAQNAWVPVGPDHDNWAIRGSGGDPATAFGPEGHLYVAAADGSASSGKVSVRKWDGSQWMNVGSPGLSAAAIWDVSLAIGPDGYPVIAYVDQGLDNRISVQRWDGETWSFIGGPGSSQPFAGGLTMDLDGDGDPVFAYERYGHTIFVQRWNGTAWVALGTIDPVMSEWENLRLVLDPSGDPYLAYQGYGTNGTARVLHWNGSAWTAVGTNPIGPVSDYFDKMDMILDANGLPVIGYADAGVNSRATVKRWTGTAWVQVGEPGFSPSFSRYHDLAIDSTGAILLACQHASGDNERLQVMRWNGLEWDLLGTEYVSKAMAYNPDLEVDANGHPVVSFFEHEYDKIRVRRWSGTAWSELGAEGSSTNAPFYTSMACGKDGNPIVSYADRVTYKANVLRWDGGAWDRVGPPDFSTAQALGQVLATDSTGHPVFAYSTAVPNGSRITVVRWNDTAWVEFGGPLVSAGQSNDLDMQLTRGGMPVVAFRDLANGNRTTVKKWSGTAWVPIGAVGFSSVTAGLQSLALDENDHPAVAYRESGNSQRLTVRRWNGSAWSVVGTSGFSAGGAFNISLVFDQQGAPVVGYTDATLDNRSFVRKWNGTDWQLLGPAGISEARVDGLQLLSRSDGSLALKQTLDGGIWDTRRWNGELWEELGTDVPLSQIMNITRGEMATNEHGNTYVVFSSGKLYVQALYAQHIQTATMERSVCKGSDLQVTYTAIGSFQAGNTFRAELSDSLGNFDDPMVIGSLVSTASGTIACTVPPSTPLGSQYRIRVLSDAPAMPWSNNGSDLTIIATPTWYIDQDGDGYGVADVATDSTVCDHPVGYASIAGDCNDADPTVRPTALETCDGVDMNCNGMADECPLLLSARILLEGPYVASIGAMADGLRTSGLLPSAHPYSTAAYVHIGGGTETMDADRLRATGPNAIVDWIFVELRQPGDPSVVVATRCGLLQRDGDVVDTNGISPIAFQGMAPGPYHIAVRHRNHLGVMSASPLALSTSPVALDLRSTGTPAYGTDARKNISGNLALWAGDVSGDGQLKYTGSANDRDPVLVRIGGTVPTATVTTYASADVNMDGVVKYTGSGNDRDIILQNIGGSVPTGVRVGQLPH